ncbi:trans-aconitate 2-methyltransferase [Thiomonas sp. FB-6]|uniref:class I SAM-dependent methyltransferase n=1 Tax=Thiomonas sp. FB-6 TaxID=1158291 RepID=UPI0003765916|nr:class I SAM-dependent methyltransferase [Thiomonas sp. FB-6]
MTMTSDELKVTFRQQAQGALSLNVAYIGIVNRLFETLHSLGKASAADLAAAAGMDAGYVTRWCDAAYAFGYLEASGVSFRLSQTGEAMRPDASGTLMPMAIQSVLSAHMAERAAGLMRTGERPGEQVLAERETVLPWFGPMLEANFGAMFETTVCPAIPAFAEVNTRGGLAVDLGCGNGWYLRALARRYANVRGLGIDGFGENIDQARRLADAQRFGSRLRFLQGDIHELTLDEPADLIAMNRALHHVWEKDPAALFAWLRSNLKAGGYAVIWEPAWPAKREALREMPRRGMAFQNLTEHVQGNHFLRPDEIVEAFDRVDMPARVHLFAQGTEAVIVAQRQMSE